MKNPPKAAKDEERERVFRNQKQRRAGMLQSSSVSANVRAWQELETQITGLEKERVVYEQQVDALRSENQVIREQQATLRKFIEQAFMKAYPEPSMTEKIPVAAHQETEKIFA